MDCPPLLYASEDERFVLDVFYRRIPVGKLENPIAAELVTALYVQKQTRKGGLGVELGKVVQVRLAVYVAERT
jgi:hypothetical protein